MKSTLILICATAALLVCITGSVLAEDSPEWLALQNRIDRLIAQLGSNEGDSARLALDQLVKIGSPAVDKLISASASTSDQKRLYAVTALGKIGDPKALKRIVFMAQYEDFPVARIAAARALYAFGDNSGGQYITEYISSQIIELRRFAVTTLGVINYAPALPLLRARITVTPNAPEPNNNLEAHPAVLCDIALAMKKMGDSDGLPLLVKISRHEQPALRKLAVLALGAFDEPLAFVALAVSISDKDASIADLAFETLYKKRKTSIPSLQKSYMEAKGDDAMTRVIEKAIKELGGEIPKEPGEILPPLVGPGESREDKDKVDGLLSLLRRAQENDQKRGIEALVAMGYSAVPRLVEVVLDESNEVKVRIIGILVRIKDERSLPLLRSLLNNPVAQVRCRSAWALGEIPANDNVPALIAALSDEDADMRFYAINSLYRLTGLKFDFEPRGAEEARAKAIALWAEWWEKNKATFKVKVA
ncbi:MAG: HEAT repeat domain-containing protein [Candidatus Brocadiia bacterium]